MTRPRRPARMPQNRALRGAWWKGYRCAAAHLPRKCPYPDTRASYNNSVTFARAFRNAWFAGYDERKTSQ